MQNIRSRSSHLNFLDGIRGATALYVVGHHILQWSFIGYKGERLPGWFRVAQVFKFGHLAVGIFIVLSGFCLMLPIARSGGDQLPRGLTEFVKRRARRILPPYFAAFGLALLLLLIPGLRIIGLGTQEYHLYSHAAMPGAIVSHLVMLHNLNREWTFRIDGPLWSVATEWQIYFFFPLLLLPLWRRFGLVMPIVVGFLLGVATIPLGLSAACFWYLGLFAMGMAGAVISSAPQIQTGLKSIRWGLIAVLLLPLCLVAASKTAIQYEAAGDLLIGLATMCLLIHYTMQANRSASSPGLRLLSSSAAIQLGAFSYSLYLIHYPLVALGQMLLNRLHVSVPMDFLILLGVGLPVILALTYAFHLVFERPFLNAPVLQRDRAVVQVNEAVSTKSVS